MGDLLVWLIVGGFILGALMYMWPVFLAAALIWGVVKLVGGFTEANKIDRDYRKDRDADLIARADKQHQAMMSGDAVTGTYGNYLPPPGLR